MFRVIGIGALALVSALTVAFTTDGKDEVRSAPKAPKTVNLVRISVPDQPSYQLEGVGYYLSNLKAFYDKVAADAEHAKQVESARRTAASAASRAASSTSSPARHTLVLDDAAFDRVAQCETGGYWSHQTAFDGGLGIAHGNWTDLRTGNGYAKYGFGPWPELPEFGSQASRELQIAAARRFIVRYGIGGWGCKAHFYG